MAKDMIVLVCGLSGSGKSVQAKLIAERYGLKCVHTSGVLRQLRDKKIKEVKIEQAESGAGFWEKEGGKKFIEERHKDTSLDKALDKKLLELIKQGNVVMDSWTMPWMSKKGIKIWLKVSDKERAKRLSARDEMKSKEVLKKAKEKEKRTAALYKKLYGFDFAKDLSVFDKIIDTDGKEIDEVSREIFAFLDKKAKKKK